MTYEHDSSSARRGIYLPVGTASALTKDGSRADLPSRRAAGQVAGLRCWPWKATFPRPAQSSAAVQRRSPLYAFVFPEPRMQSKSPKAESLRTATQSISRTLRAATATQMNRTDTAAWLTEPLAAHRRSNTYQDVSKLSGVPAATGSLIDSHALTTITRALRAVVT